MNKIKRSVETTAIFTTSDGQNFRELRDARNHQKHIDKKGVAKQLEEYICKLYDVSSQQEIDDMYNEEDKWNEAEALEKKRNKYFYDNCIGMFRDFDIEEVAELFIEMWQSFGEENIGKFFLFIKERL